MTHAAPRYQVVAGGERGDYEVDTLTGRVWALGSASSREKTELTERGAADVDPRGQLLTEAEIAQVELLQWALYEPGRLYAKLYNGGAWDVGAAVVTVTAVEPDGTVRWSRAFDAYIGARPLSIDDFEIKLHDTADLDLAATRVELTRVWGRPPR